MMTTLFKAIVIGLVLLLATVFCPSAAAQSEEGKVQAENAELKKRVAALEKTVAELKQQIRNDKLINQLSGRWVEAGHLNAGQRITERDEVAWVLTTEASSQRMLLAAEVQSTPLGSFSVDASKSPAWITFHLRSKKDGKTYQIRGLVKHSYRRAEIVLPGKLFRGRTFLDPPRPTDFTSTPHNGYSVHKLVRDSYKKTGVW